MSNDMRAKKPSRVSDIINYCMSNFRDFSERDWRDHGFTRKTYEKALEWIAEHENAVLQSSKADPAPSNMDMRAGDTHPPEDEDKLWRSGITVGLHGNAIECYGRTKELAEQLRDSLLSHTSPALVATPEGWISVKDRPPSRSEPIVYRRPNGLNKWSVGIAYWTVSQKWNPELNSEAAPTGFTHYLLLPDVSNSPAPTQEQRVEPVADHVIRETVNKIRDVAIQYRDAQQLRERIAHIVVPLLKGIDHPPRATKTAQEPVSLEKVLEVMRKQFEQVFKFVDSIVFSDEEGKYIIDKAVHELDITESLWCAVDEINDKFDGYKAGYKHSGPYKECNGTKQEIILGGHPPQATKPSMQDFLHNTLAELKPSAPDEEVL